MTEPTTALQTALRTRLIADAGVSALVPAANIVDRNARPEVFPVILIGEGRMLDDPSMAVSRVRVFSVLHVFVKEPSLAQAKAIAWAIRQCLRPSATWTDLDGGWWASNVSFVSAEYIRDPTGEHSHAAIEIEALMGET